MARGGAPRSDLHGRPEQDRPVALGCVLRINHRIIDNMILIMNSRNTERIFYGLHFGVCIECTVGYWLLDSVSYIDSFVGHYVSRPRAVHGMYSYAMIMMS